MSNGTVALADGTMQRVEVAGLPIAVVDAARVHDMLHAAVIRRPRPGWRLCTVNLDYLSLAARDPSFHSVVQAADLTLADGTPVIWLSRLSGQGLPERVTGADLTTWLVDGGIPGVRLFLLGSSSAVCVAVRERAQRANVEVVGWNAAEQSVFDDPEQSRGLVSEVNTAKPDILLVALGAPRQDLWLARHREVLDVAVMVGIGGSLDIVAGQFRRAPAIVRRMGLEWAFRLAQEPRRLWRRYLIDDLPFLARAAVAAIRQRRARRDPD